ncbi:hypothetical protein [Prosthecobacter vanneervenii]|uniref:Uncharacterized protein n=1 Tax=Prosthecobacter vanneervenii TaxID=48466 RepID=A0A7W8DN28_9BACT|nr:hypothetical protein [Prosthecobacter vanneervenii]MBB5035466.1 hypothetical protein [Prosthecobacter vanneervenii]
MTHTADSSGQQTRPPGTTIDAGEIEKARAIVTNLDKVGSKRKLNPNEQQAYDRARGLLERESSAQTGTRDGSRRPGDRNTGNPKELVMAGDGPVAQGHAVADAPPPAAAVQPADAIGTTIEGAGAANPDAPRASANEVSGDSGAHSTSQPKQQDDSQESGPTNTVADGVSTQSHPTRPASASSAVDHSTSGPTSPPIDYPRAADGDFRSNWKTSTAGRRVKLEDGREGVVTAVAKDHTLTVSVDGKSIEGISQNKVKMQLSLDELAAEQAFIKRQQSFKRLKPEYDRRLEDIAKSIPEAHVILAPLKGAPRALEKVAKVAKRKGDDGKSPSPEKAISKLTDMLRGSIVVDSIDQVPEATRAVLRSFAPDAKLVGTNKWGASIYQTGDGRKVIVNDRFKNPTAEGYSDVQIMLEMTPGHMVETQIHIPEMIVAKEGDSVKALGLPEKYWPENLPINGFDPKRTGHHMYEEKRSLPDDSPAADLVALEMKKLNQAAMDAHRKRHSKPRN